MKRVLLWHTLGFALGIGAGNFFHIPVGAAFALALGALVFSGYILCRAQELRFLVIFSCCVGILWGQVHYLALQDIPFTPGERIQALGMAAGEPSPTAGGKIFSFQVFQGAGAPRTKGKIQVLCAAGEKVRYGDVLHISGEVLDTTPPSNPHQFDYPAYLKRHGIEATVSTLYGGSITPTGENRGHAFLALVFGLKEKMARVLGNLPPQQSAFIGGMLFGEKGTLSFEERNVLSQTGLMDAFAVSGVHVGYVVLFTLLLAQLFKLNKWNRLFLVLFAVVFYAALSEFTPSVLRSGAMAVMGLLAYSLGEKKDFYTALAFAALPLLIVHPQMLFDAGFQLSFIAAGGVVYLMPAVRDWFPQKGGVWWDALAAAVSAQLALMPLIAYYFNVLTVAGVIVSILASGLVGVVVLLGLFSLVLSIISVPLAVLPAYGAGILVEGIWRAAKVISDLPGSYHTVKTPNLFWLCVFYGILFCLPYLSKIKRGKFYQAAALGIFIVFLALPVSGNGRLNVTFVDVGQGDCIFLQSPSGRTCLIDGGGKPNASGSQVGERIVVPYLKSLGLERLDLVLLTHPDEDHMLGLFPTLDELKVDKFVFARPFVASPELQPLLELAERKNVPAVPVTRGQEIFLDRGIKLYVCSPGQPFTGTDADTNNNCLVLKLSYGHVSFLLTGDAEIACLTSLLDSGLDLKADVLKLPHHGSKNSFLPSFYEQVSPRMVVVCVGKNSFGHPGPEVVEYWEEREIPLFRTDLHGAVTFSTDGKEIRVQTFKDG
ncbi:DNA internalization-related competence protein ComEC/Rec2 [Candidatus Formimonas warabiya]|uniref:DNA internalization-related competence protein ComEC/Rec2 n=1 Tax=Formimonas warabiya TaxID=1761012 RepID=A0A3G1KT79_FORW1|nr:DNA internalization-related competence protein ComEC/Rec2 [Candidatus Formimonas warabiya]ATW25365.1 DNA internalization-related competence protein ComEC/Rec2 [Candidatus Formimonas warabiya]